MFVDLSSVINAKHKCTVTDPNLLNIHIMFYMQIARVHELLIIGNPLQGVTHG